VTVNQTHLCLNIHPQCDSKFEDQLQIKFLLDKPDINFGNILRSFSGKSLILPSKTNGAHLVTSLLKSLEEEEEDLVDLVDLHKP
jgi:hypothetical protein